MSFLAGESQRGFFKQPIGSGRKRRVPVCWPFNVDLFGFVTGKGIDLPVEAADAPPVVAQPALVSTKVKDTQPVPVNAFGETLQSFPGIDPDNAFGFTPRLKGVNQLELTLPGLLGDLAFWHPPSFEIQVHPRNKKEVPGAGLDCAQARKQQI